MKFTNDTYLDFLDEQEYGKEYEQSTENVVVCKLIEEKYNGHTGQVSLVKVLENIDVFNYQDEEIFLVKGDKAFCVFEAISGDFKTFNEYLEDLLGDDLKYDTQVAESNKSYFYLTSNENIFA